MKFTPAENSCAYGETGIFRGYATFDNPTLGDYVWPVCEIRGSKPGPKLCVSAGVHVNEVSSIEAAIRLQKLFPPEKLSGTVSILPVLNIPGQFEYCEYECPVDGKNLLYLFPGNKNGSFSEALTDSVMNEWCAGADCYIDMHGGALRENVQRFIFFQLSDDAQFEKKARELALCFDANVVYGLAKEYMQQPYLTSSGFGREGRIALISESGRNGVLDEKDISYHIDGVLNVARTLGMIDSPMTGFQHERVVCVGEYMRPACPADGMFYSEVEPGDRVKKGQRLGVVKNLFGDVLGEIIAPASGLIPWRMTHPLEKKGTWLYGLVVPEDQQEKSGAVDGKKNLFAVHGKWNS